MNQQDFDVIVQDFDVIVQDTIQSIQKLLQVKGGEYAGTEDRLSNFKIGAGLTGFTLLQVLHTYLSKHYYAVSTYVRDSAEGISRERSEPIAGRLDDIINYAILAKALIAENELVGAAKAENKSEENRQTGPIWISIGALKLTNVDRYCKKMFNYNCYITKKEYDNLLSMNMDQCREYLKFLGAPV